MQDMRAPDYGDLTMELFTGIKKVLRTDKGHVMFFPGSGTGAWEAAITNTLNPGDKVLMARYGHFSTLWVDMAQRLGLNVEIIDIAWGAGVPVNEISRRLGSDAKDEIKAVFVTHNETSTGVTSDIAAVRRALDENFHDALLFVDGVSSIGSLDFRMDEWEVDLVVAGSQKGLMLPAGLGILGVSEKAVQTSKLSTMRRAYFDFDDMLKMNKNGYWPYTPPTQLFYGLRASLNIIEAEGLENIVARHKRLAQGVRHAIAAWGLDLVAEHQSLYSDTVSAIRVPNSVDARDVLHIAYEDFNTSFGSGLGPLNGKVFRIGHLGDMNEGMCLTAITIAEMSLVRAGASLELGVGVGAAQAWFLNSINANSSFNLAAE
jgi:alanine-glyoxylate transaminase/serine-glyoxylate transaminase/serine-pyruvate transaminase